MSPVLLASPSAEPVSLADAKAWLRIDTADEDSLVASLVPAARARVEAATRRLLVTQTWRLAFDAWPNDTPAGPFGRAVGPITANNCASACAGRQHRGAACL